jgi:hypothetical protein
MYRSIKNKTNLNTQHINTITYTPKHALAWHAFLSILGMRSFIITCIVWLGVSVQGWAQSDTVRHDERNFTNPESFYNSELPKDTGPMRDSVRLEGNKIPRKLKKTLQGDNLYRGWEDAGVYLDTNTKLYMLYLTSDSLTRKYGFDEYGKVVTFTQFIRQP